MVQVKVRVGSNVQIITVPKAALASLPAYGRQQYGANTAVLGILKAV